MIRSLSLIYCRCSCRRGVANSSNIEQVKNTPTTSAFSSLKFGQTSSVSVDYTKPNEDSKRQDFTACWRNLAVISGLLLGSAVLIREDSSKVHAAEKYLNENEKRVILLLKACKDNDLQAIRKLIKDGADVNGKHNLGWTPLMVAAMNGYMETVKILLDAKANPNLPDSYSQASRMAKEAGLTRKHIQTTRDEEFSHLLSNQNFRGSTALHYAALSNNKSVMSALIQAGADPLIVNAQGFKPSQFSAREFSSLFQNWEYKYEDRRKEREADMRRRFPMEQRFKERLVGQESAINVVSSAVRRKENGWFDGDHPLVMLFLGSSGIGKTELAKQLASYLHGEKRDAFIRIDMSEYQTKHEAAKFIGAPPGYIGHEEGGQLTSRLKKFPSAVVLFDEVDKAHPDVMATLLQLFDEGRITDGKGVKVECKDAIFIMTANIANEEISQHAIDLRSSTAREMNTEGKRDKTSESSEADSSSGDTGLSREFRDTVIHPLLKQAFKREEFIGRINEIVYFLPFNAEELNRLVTRQLNFWAGKAYSVHKIELKWDQPVVELLAKGYDLRYGARSIMYEVERQVVSKLAAFQEKQLITTKDKLLLKVKNGKIDVEKLTSNKYQSITSL